MRSFGVVLDAPRFDHASGVREAQEPVFVQAFVTDFVRDSSQFIP
jgi:hypothetical protein